MTQRWPWRRGATTLSVICWGLMPACGNGGENAAGASCAGVGEVADALTDVGVAAGDTSTAAAHFDRAADTFDQVPSPPELERAWPLAVAALRYYAQTAREYATGQGDQAALRSASDVETWRNAFEEIADFAMDRCRLGWRTAFDECRSGSPPPGAAETRLLFPCRT